MIYKTLRCLIVIVALKISFDTVDCCSKGPDYTSFVGSSVMRDSDQIFLFPGKLLRAC